MRRTIATFAAIGSLTAAGVMLGGNAWASPQACSGDSCWHVVNSDEPTFAACTADGIALVINGEFGGPFIAYKCDGNKPGTPDYYILKGETAV